MNEHLTKFRNDISDFIKKHEEHQKNEANNNKTSLCVKLPLAIEVFKWIQGLPDEDLDNLSPALFNAPSTRISHINTSFDRLLAEADSQKIENYARSVNGNALEALRECASIYSTLNLSSRFLLTELPSWREEFLDKINEVANSRFSDWEERTSTQKIDQSINERKGEIASLKATITILENRASNLDKKMSIAERAQTFSTSAKRHEELKYVWIGLAAVMGLFMALYVLLGIEKPADTSGAVAFFVIQKLTLISVLSTLLILFARMFRVEAHNEIANRHRADALNTFDKFYDRGDDDETKRAVLVQAITAAFAPLDTGIAKSAPPPAPVSDLPKLIADAVKSAMGK